MYFIENKTKGVISYPHPDKNIQLVPGSNQIPDALWSYVKQNFAFLKTQIESDAIAETHVVDGQPSEDKPKHAIHEMSKELRKRHIKSTFIESMLNEMLEGADKETAKLLNDQIKLVNKKNKSA